jgi:SM-20-related protein
MITVFDSIADNLAERGYAIADQFLSQKEVEDILDGDDFKNGRETFRKAGIGKNHDLQINEGIRGDYIRWIDKDSSSPPLRKYLDRVGELISFLNQTLFLSLKDSEIHMTIYPAGTFYRRHLDQFKKDDHRKLSLICYLNRGWRTEEGGELRMYVPDGPVDILPLAGRLVCFRSDQIEHEVLPATRERLSLTGWLLDQHSDLRHLR